MIINWQDCEEAKWKVDEKKKFIDEFDKEIWPNYYNLLQNQPISSLGVNTFNKLNEDINLRIDFEVSEDRTIISVFIFPWFCIHKPTTICDAWKDEKPWLIGRVEM